MKTKKITLAILSIAMMSCANQSKKMEIIPAVVVESPNEDINDSTYTLKETIYANRLSDGNYELTLKNEGTYNIFWGNEQCSIDFSKATTLSGKETTILMTNPIPTKRMFFAAVNATDTLFISERELDLENSINVRDLGGIPTQDGKHVKWGKVFRAGALPNLTEADKAYLAEVGLKTIIDLRSDHEIEEQPDTYPEGVEWVNIQLGGENTNPNDISQMMQAMKEMKPDSDGSEIMGEFGKKFAQRGDLFKEEFEIFLNPEKQNILFHCTAGKDRTGHTSAMFLYALGVDKETICDEYELSNYFRSKKAQPGMNSDGQMKAMVEKYGIPEHAMIMMNGVHRNWLNMFFAEVETQFGSLDNFLAQECGVDGAAKEKLREMYLQ